MKQIKLSNTSAFALVDDEDFDMLHEYSWYLCGVGYAYGRIDNEICSLHRKILNLKKDDRTYVDHIDDNRLNNQKSNLRKCTNQENSRNSRKTSKITSSKYKGVSWNKKISKWRVRIFVNNKGKHIGAFDCEIMAAKAYDIYADKYFGEFARLNFPDELNDGSVMFRRPKTSKYKNVYFCKTSQKWIVQIARKTCGSFNTELDAFEYINRRQLIENS